MEIATAYAALQLVRSMFPIVQMLAATSSDPKLKAQVEQMHQHMAELEALTKGTPLDPAYV